MLRSLRLPLAPACRLRCFLLGLVLVLSAAGAVAQTTRPPPLPQWRFEYNAAGKPNKIVFKRSATYAYDLEYSGDLAAWTNVGESAQPGAAGLEGWMQYAFTPGNRGFFRWKVVDNFSLIPEEYFLMGDQTNPPDSGYYSDELPVHSVLVNDFHMARCEVTKALWDEVRAWGLANGYTDLPVGSYYEPTLTNFSKGQTHPVHYISWYAIVKWCNALSQREGLVPCYYTNAGKTTVYKTGITDLTNLMVKWDANGYRLPTEAEWEKAARGGTAYRFPWGDSINHDYANYIANSTSFGYDTSGCTSDTPHPSYTPGGNPFTSPVGSFEPNGYGLYDMAGNVWEWCWDWYGEYPADPVENPHGPASASPGAGRVFRGGSWYDSAYSARISCRGTIPKTDDGFDLYGMYYYGFRLARTKVAP